MKSFWRSPFLTLLILAADALMLALLWIAAYDLRAAMEGGLLFWDGLSPLNPRELYTSALPWMLPFWLGVLAYHCFYSHHERIADLNNLRNIFWALFWMGLVVAIYNFTHKSDFGRSVLFGYLLSSGLWLWLSRTAFRVLKRRSVQQGHGRVRALVVGTGDVARETLRRVSEHPDIGFRLIGCVATSDDAPGEVMDYEVLGQMDDLLRLVQRHRIEEVFMACDKMSEDRVFETINEVQDNAPVVFKVVANMLLVIVNRAKVDEVTHLPVIAFRGRQFFPVELFAKRLLDMVIAGLALVVLSPLIALFAWLIRKDSPGPALFVHERMGRNGDRFQMYKFRTMYADAEEYAEAPSDQSDPRVTRIGRVLRKTSLDEIPQLWNVVKGDMSVVGPRPEMPFIVSRYSSWQATRMLVRPGVTGLWQVAGRKNLPLHDNLEYDFYYVRNQSLALDIEIMLRTVPAVLLGRGAF